MTGVDSIGLNNPMAAMYAQQQTPHLNDDFMSKAYGIDQTAQTPQTAFTGNLTGQPNMDCYQGSSSLGNALKYGIAGGLGAGAGAYFFGGEKLEMLPFKNGQFNDKILKTLEGDIKELADTKAKELFATKKTDILTSYHFKDTKEFEAIEKYVLAEDTTKLPKEVTDLVPDNIKNEPSQFADAKIRVAQARLDIDSSKKRIAQDAFAEVKANHLGYQQDKLINLQKRESLLNGLAKDADKAKYEELIKSNPKAFGIEATEKTAIEAKAKDIAASFTDKESSLNSLKETIKTQKDKVAEARKYVNGKYASYWDDSAKALTEGAPENLTKAVKNFKLTKAGKWGAIAAGALAVVSFILGK